MKQQGMKHRGLVRLTQVAIASAAFAMLAACGGGSSSNNSSSSATPAGGVNLQVVSFGDSLSDVGTYSPVIGAGCYTDQDIGSAGATGSGEENIKVAGAHTIVENMRRGMSPLDAGLDALKRIVRNYNNDMNKLQFVDMTYYILRKDGAYAGVSLWQGYTEKEPHQIAVHDGTRRSEATVFLFKGPSHEFPPFPVNMPTELTKDSVYVK